MAFGFKMKKLETKKDYSIEELYEVIKDKEFSAGKPELVKNGFAMIIAFPPIDHNNQVQITPGKLGKPPYNKFNVLKAEPAGLGNVAKNAAISKLTGGWSDMSAVFGKKAKSAEALVVAAFEELQAMGL